MSAATPLKTVASVISVSGEAFARSGDGAVRRLAAGDVILEGEVVFTLANGQVELAFADGHAATILASESYLMGPETLIATSPDVYEAALAAAGEVGKVVQALEEGGDILEELEAPAAGAAAENSGNSFVRLLRISEGVTPVGYEFPINPSEEIRAPEGDVIPEEAPPEEPVNGLPSANPVEVTLDDEGLHAGIPGGIGDVAGEAASHSAILPFTFGPDGAGDIHFEAMHGETALLGVETVTFAWDDDANTLTASSAERGDVFTITVDPVTGEYTVTLLQPVLHEPGSDENDATVVLTYTVVDGNGDSAHNSFTLTIDDDTPVAGSADTGVLANQMGNILVGDLNVLSGADTPLSYALNLTEGSTVIGKDGKPLTSGSVELTWHYDASHDYWVAQDSKGASVFTVQVNPDGTYTVHLIGLLDGAGGELTLDLTSGVRGGNTYDLALFDIKAINHGPNDNDSDNDGVADNAGIMIFVRGLDSDGNLDTVNSSVQGMGVGQGTTIDNPGEKHGVNPLSEVLTLWFAEPQNPALISDPQNQLALDAVNKVEITLDQLSGGETAYWQAYLVDSEGNEILVGSGSVAGTGSGSSDPSDETLLIQGIGDFNKLVFTASDDGDYRIASVTAYSEQDGYDNALTLPVLATDADGDTVPTSFDVWFSGDGTLTGTEANDVLVSGSASEQLYGQAGNDQLYGGGGSDILVGGEGDDILVGGTGDDLLSGGAGNDTFVWRPADLGTAAEPARDVISDWGNGTDVIDLSDVLQTSDLATLDGHLSFSLNGDGHTEIGISSAYEGPVVQTIVIEGVDLVTGFADDQAIIQHLLDNGRLVTEA